MYDDLIARLGGSLADMSSNVWHVYDEAKKRDMPEAVRDDVDQVWSEYFWTWKDVQEEQLDLQGKLGMRPGQSPQDADTASPDPRVSMSWISTWLRETVDSGHALVSRLDEASQSDPALGNVYMLMAGFQVNVVNTHAAIEETLVELGSRLDALDVGVAP